MLISPITRRHWKTRVLIGVLYTLLGAGAVTMVYPFLLMVAGSTKSGVDAQEQRIVPSFLVEEESLYHKFIEGLFNESLNEMRWAYDMDCPMFQSLPVPRAAAAQRLVEEWEAFLDSGAPGEDACEAGFLAAPQSRRVVPSALRDFKERLQQDCGGDIGRLNRQYSTTFKGWSGFYVVPRNGMERRGGGECLALDRAVIAFCATRPAALRYYFSAEGFFKAGYLKPLYSSDVLAYNRAHGTSYQAWSEIHLSRTAPDPEAGSALEHDDWERFVRGVLALGWIRASPSAAEGYRTFLLAKYGSLDAYNQRFGTAYRDPAQVPFPSVAPPSGIGRADWESYLQGWRHPVTGQWYAMPLAALELDTVEFRFREWLQRKYGSLDRLSAALAEGRAREGTDSPPERLTAWLQVVPPQREYHYRYLKGHEREWRMEFATRNIRSVMDYLMWHGDAVVNTLLYCGLAVLGALLVNPLAAYALSRYRPRSTYLVLLFLMLTMAFPPMVTQIPVFLMLRRLDLLNTFAALILPALANGYTIFLLKGFFDSLPRELYECAQLDGAGEFRLFWQLTMRLSTPILSVTALGAFTGAYTNFMMALLVCQDERMWTLMPWLYQLQSSSGPGVIFASLVLASLPTLIVFLLCQKVIMRGIVVPVEK